MDWRVKALLQSVLSRVPAGESINYLLQKHVSRSLPMNSAGLAASVEYASRHLDAVRPYLARPLGEATFYEFGAGWDLAGPLAFYALGVERQTLVDIRALVRLELVNHVIRLFSHLETRLNRKPDHPLRYLAELRTIYGIDYRAPCDAGHTGLDDGSVDCVTSTFTLEHIPPGEITSILRECHRCLRPGGVMSHLIDYQDHYAYFDPKIGRLNFLRYSEQAWAAFNPPLQYQNRLRHRDHRALLEACGFQVLAERLHTATAADLENLDKLPMDARFRGYTREDLTVLDAALLVRKL